jgi:DNA replication protein DnaC
VVAAAADRLVIRGEEISKRELTLEADRESARIRNNLAALWRARGERYESCQFANYSISPGSDHQQAVKDTLEGYARHMRQEIAAGTNIVLTGLPGTGKDHLLAALMRQAVCVGRSVKWTSGALLFARLRDDIDKGASESATAREYTSPDVLCISDPVWDGQPLTKQQRMKLGEIVDVRYNHRRAIWVSINASSRTEAEEALGVALVDRLRDGAVSKACDWASHRTSRRAQ